MLTSAVGPSNGRPRSIYYSASTRAQIPRNVDLIEWPSIVWYQPEYSVYVMRQASRRSWRIGQRQPVEVTYLVYEGTLQAQALALVAAKLRSALMIDGELPGDGLAALEGDGEDMLLALARRLTERGAGDAESLEALFARTRESEATSEEYLVDGDWSTAPAPTAGAQPPEPGDVADLWRRVFADELSGGTPDTSPPPEGGGRTVAFEELARLVRRPRPRRRPAAGGQLTLLAG